MRRWSLAWFALSLAALALLSACGSSTGGWSEAALSKSAHGIQVQVINSQVVAGPTRLAFGLFADNGTLVQDASGKVKLFRLDAKDNPTPAGEYDLRAVSIHATGSKPDSAPLATMYVTNVSLAQKDWWGAQLSIDSGGKHYDDLRARFFVSDKGTVPAIGAPAPRSKQPVLSDVKDIAEIDSSTPPHPELHNMTVADAIDSHKPTVVAFATPAFCQTRFCGPVIDEVVVPLSKDYAGRANFIHIEPYTLAEARQGKLLPVPQMAEWGLTSEPYIFVLDANGKVAAQFEGITARDEVQAVLDRLLKAG